MPDAMDVAAEVSIHAPVKDATSIPSAGPEAACFNPRAREGRDCALSGVGSARSCFNPRAREGRDLSGAM